MRMSALGLGSALGACLLFSARADDREARLDRLEKQGQQLAAELEQLKQDLLAAKVARKAEAEQPQVRVTLDWKDGFKLATRDKQHALQFGGDVQFDGRFAVDGDDSSTRTFDIPRARLVAQGHVWQYYYFRLQTNFAGSRVTLFDAYIDFQFIPEAQLRAGQFKVPIGNEDIGRLRGPLMENSLAGDFLTQFRDIGVELRGSPWKRFSYWAGIFNGSGPNRTDTNDDKDVAARLLLHPFQPTKSVWLRGLQAGGAIWHGEQDADLAGGGPRTNAGTRFFTYRPGTRNVGDRTTVGLEAAWNVGPVGLAGEYLQMDQDLRRSGASDSVRYRGWYAQASWFLTGEDATFGRVQPKKPFDPASQKPGLGAWQLAARVGQLEGEDALRPFVTGSRDATQYVAGLNWYPHSMLRLSLNWEHVTFGDTVGRGKSEDALLFRVQLEF